MCRDATLRDSQIGDAIRLNTPSRPLGGSGRMQVTLHAPAFVHRRRRRLDVLWALHQRCIPARGCLRRSHPQGYPFAAGRDRRRDSAAFLCAAISLTTKTAAIANTAMRVTEADGEKQLEPTSLGNGDSAPVLCPEKRKSKWRVDDAAHKQDPGIGTPGSDRGRW